MTNKSTFSKLKEQEKHTRQSIIIDAAEKQFAKKPFHEVTMRDIAQEAGISPASIYRHFPDQQALFVETFSRGIREILDSVEDTINTAKTSPIEKVADLFIEYFSNNDQYFRVMTNFFLTGPVQNDLFEKLNCIEREMLDQLDTLFSMMNVKGDTRFISHAFFASLTGVLTIFRGHPDKDSDDMLKHRKRIAAMIADLFQKGLQK